MTYMMAGLVLGLSAGFAPGPMLTLVLSETLRHGARSGLQVALSPIFTDAPIIIMTLLVVSQLADVEPVLGGISLLGAAVLLWMGYDSWQTQPVQLDRQDLSKGHASLRKGMLVNLLNPHPYLFWFTVGAPLLVRAWQSSLGAVAAFLLCFYGLLVGSKVLLALLVGRYRHFLSSAWYLNTMRVLGVVLWGFAALLAWEGLALLGVL